MPVNVAPAEQAAYEDTLLVFNDSNDNRISVTDSTNTDVLTVTIEATNGTVTLSGPCDIQFTSGDGTDDEFMVFTGTLSAINIALDDLIYTPDINFSGLGSLTITTIDGNGGEDSDTVAITTLAVNDAPENTFPDVFTVNVNGDVTFDDLSVSDVDSGTLRVTLTATDGELDLFETTGLDFSNGDGSGDTTMTFTGSIGDINTALSGLTYSPNPGFAGLATVTITSNDQGNTGLDPGTSGDANSEQDSDVIGLNYASGNLAPSITTPAAQIGTEDADLVFSVGTGNAISVEDPGGGWLLVTLQVTHGHLNLASTDGLHFISGDATHTTMTFSGSIEAINAALDGLIYRGDPNYNGSTTLTVQTTDGQLSASVGVSITLLDDGEIEGTNNDDNLVGTKGADFISGFACNDLISGLDGSDHLSGGDGQDTLIGGKGDDFLFGNRGNDVLTGDQGRDTFVVEFSSGDDRITDLGKGDKIQFSALPGVDDLSDLTLTRIGMDMLVTWGTGDSLLIEGIRPKALNESYFIFS